MAETLRLKTEKTSATMALRFVEKAGRYILQQKMRVKYGTALPKDVWRDVELFKEAS